MPRPAPSPDLAIRPAEPDDLLACARIWRAAINDYTDRLNQPPIPDDLTRIVGLYEHLRATDPDRFVVARLRVDGSATEPPVAFGAAVVRERLWYLSMLFVRPEAQGSGLGRRIIEHLLPAPDEGLVRAIGTDSAQPISNALYASYGIVPRMALWYLVAPAIRPGVLPPLPAGVRAVPFDEVAAGPPGGPGHARLVAAVDELDRELAGFSHPQDHRHLRLDDRLGFLYFGAGRSPIGYGYTSRSGRLGPVAVRDAALLPAIHGHLVGQIRPKGAYAAWVPGEADRILPELLRAGFRIEGFPVLLAWDRPFADFSRYLPISPGLL